MPRFVWSWCGRWCEDVETRAGYVEKTGGFAEKPGTYVETTTRFSTFEKRSAVDLKMDVENLWAKAENIEN